MKTSSIFKIEFLKFALKATFFLQAFIAPSSLALGDEPINRAITFDEAWRTIQGENPAIQASRSDLSAAQVASQRAYNHWYPRLFATGKIFSTSDPGANFMYTLEERQISAQDFAPNQLNHPGSNVFEQAGLGLDLPIYEAGSKVAASRASDLVVQSKKAETESVIREEYARLARDFALLLSLSEEKRQLSLLAEDVDRILNRYSIGSKSNPVGYSGLLGLKNLKNRIQGLLIQNRAQLSGRQNDVNALIPEQAQPSWMPNWEVKPERTESLLSRVFPVLFSSSNTTATQVPSQVQAMRLGAQALDEAKAAEKARFLPRVGLFAQGDLYSGSRDTATNYTGGAYLQWDIFNMQNMGALSEAEHRSEAAHYHADATDSQLRAQSASTLEAFKASRDTLKLLDDSAGLLEEQTVTARELFKNGSINALQLVEVLNRRADLLENRRDAEAAMAESASQNFLSSGNGINL